MSWSSPSVRVSLVGRMPIASTQTQEGGCTPHWRRLFRALYTVLSPGLETGALGYWIQTDSR